MIFGNFLKENKKKDWDRKKRHNERIIKDKIIRGMRTRFEQEKEEDY